MGRAEGSMLADDPLSYDTPEEYCRRGARHDHIAEAEKISLLQLKYMSLHQTLRSFLDLLWLLVHSLSHHLHYATARIRMDAMGDAFKDVGPRRTRPAQPGTPIDGYAVRKT